MKCSRCLNDIEPNASEGVTICGCCADELRQEQNALEDQAIFEAQERAKAEFEASRDAYEEEEQARHFDDGGGYRYA